jgi:predicted dehydrogenase
MKSTKVLLVGAGPMAVEYAKVLDQMGVDFSVKGRGAGSAETFFASTGKEPSLSWGDVAEVASFTHCIVAVSEESLLTATLELTQQGFKNILVEKPGADSIETMLENIDALTSPGIEVYVAYNRRYYKIIDILLERVAIDGGITSLHFDFSERSRVIEPLKKAPGVKENWLFHNSTHVIDLVSFITGGWHLERSQTSGSLDWHTSGSVFSGMGKSVNGGLVTYNSDWKSPGGWEILVRTNKRRFFLKPLETLSITNLLGETELLNESSFTAGKTKPGLEVMLQDFLSPAPSARLMTAKNQIDCLGLYDKIIRGRA